MSTNTHPVGLGAGHNEYVVTAVYLDPVSLFSTTVLAASADDAVDLAWLECCDGNGWNPEERSRESEWASDVMVEPVRAPTSAVSITVTGALAPGDAVRLAAFIESAKTYACILGRSLPEIGLAVHDAGAVGQSLTVTHPGARPMTLPMRAVN